MISGVGTKQYGVFKFGSYTLDEDKISLYIQHTEDLTDLNSIFLLLGQYNPSSFPAQTIIQKTTHKHKRKRKLI
jgi:hypothetical protein